MLPPNPDTPDPHDPFGPPKENVVVGCLHCQQVYDSYRIEWRDEPGRNGQPWGSWCCPIEGCDGRGFGFDIFPTDPNYRDENGELMWRDDAEEDEWSDDQPPDDPPPSKRSNGRDDDPIPF